LAIRTLGDAGRQPFACREASSSGYPLSCRWEARKRHSGAGKLRFDCSSRRMRFKRNRTRLVLRQRIADAKARSGDCSQRVEPPLAEWCAARRISQRCGFGSWRNHASKLLARAFGKPNDYRARFSS